MFSLTLNTSRFFADFRFYRDIHSNWSLIREAGYFSLVFGPFEICFFVSPKSPNPDDMIIIHDEGPEPELD